MQARTGLALALSAIVVGGCEVHSDNAGKIEGTRWVSLECVLNNDILPPQFFALEFRTNGTCEFQVGAPGKPGAQWYAGTYSLGSGEVVKLKFKEKINGITGFAPKIRIDGDSMTLTEGEGAVIPLIRDRSGEPTGGS